MKLFLLLIVCYIQAKRMSRRGKSKSIDNIDFTQIDQQEIQDHIQVNDDLLDIIDQQSIEYESKQEHDAESIEFDQLLQQMMSEDELIQQVDLAEQQDSIPQNEPNTEESVNNVATDQYDNKANDSNQLEQQTNDQQNEILTLDQVESVVDYYLNNSISEESIAQSDQLIDPEKQAQENNDNQQILQEVTLQDDNKISNQVEDAQNNQTQITDIIQQDQLEQLPKEIENPKEGLNESAESQIDNQLLQEEISVEAIKQEHAEITQKPILSDQVEVVADSQQQVNDDETPQFGQNEFDQHIITEEPQINEVPNQDQNEQNQQVIVDEIQSIEPNSILEDNNQQQFEEIKNQQQVVEDINLQQLIEDNNHQQVVEDIQFIEDNDQQQAVEDMNPQQFIEDNNQQQVVEDTSNQDIEVQDPIFNIKSQLIDPHQQEYDRSKNLDEHNHDHDHHEKSESDHHHHHHHHHIHESIEQVPQPIENNIEQNIQVNDSQPECTFENKLQCMGEANEQLINSVETETKQDFAQDLLAIALQSSFPFSDLPIVMQWGLTLNVFLLALGIIKRLLSPQGGQNYSVRQENQQVDNPSFDTSLLNTQFEVLNTQFSKMQKEHQLINQIINDLQTKVIAVLEKKKQGQSSKSLNESDPQF